MPKIPSKLLSQVMSELGKGCSARKLAACRANGKRGGRPRKSKPADPKFPLA